MDFIELKATKYTAGFHSKEKLVQIYISATVKVCSGPLGRAVAILQDSESSDSSELLYNQGIKLRYLEVKQIQVAMNCGYMNASESLILP